MLVVVALGGNALLRRGEPADVETQRRNVREAVESVALLAADHRVVVTHGNGPQVGLLALQGDAYRDVAPYPLDVLDAESEGMIGYLLEQGLASVLPKTPAATLLTQVIVDRDDPAFAAPSKPIGPVYDRGAAARLVRDRGWTVAPDGEGFRRVVPSPQPRAIVELSAITTLLDAGVITICLGGGGIPVVLDPDGSLHGVAAVIDKDLSAALLARELQADALLLLTDVPCVERHHGTPLAHPIGAVGADELDPRDFAPGSMRPKVEAAVSFASATGRMAAIGALGDAAEILAGRRGTRVLADHETPILATEHGFHRLAERTDQLELDAEHVRRLAGHSYKPILGTGPAPKRPSEQRE